MKTHQCYVSNFILQFILFTILILQGCLIAEESLELSQWQGSSSSIMEYRDGALKQELKEDAKYDGIVKSQALGWKKDSDYQFSCVVITDQESIAYIQVKLYKDNKELKRISSRQNNSKQQTLQVQFNTGEADKVMLLCRIVRKGKNFGKTVKFEQFYFGVPKELKSVLKKNSQIIPPAPKFELVPGYQVCSVYYNDCKATDYNQIQSELFFRKAGDNEWKPALTPIYIRHEKSLRGSLLQLQEDTSYEIKLRVTDCGKTEERTSSFHTKGAPVAVARTIILTQEDINAPWTPESGTAEGYIRYTALPGTTLDFGKNNKCAIMLKDASHVILEGLKIRGGGGNAIEITDSNHIQIINCDISGFGRVGEFRPDIDGKHYYNGKAIWRRGNSGINILDSNQILIERNYIHDPDALGNSWFYSHPSGPGAVYVGNSSAVTLRYNDFVGSDAYRWDDAVGGLDNFSPQGGFKRDAEIYGNYMAFGNDDGLELDGGQMNARFYHNLVEGFFCGVSVAACIRGPSYLYQNSFVRPGDIFYYAGNSIKFINGMRCQWSTVVLLNNLIQWRAGILLPNIVAQQSPLFLLYAHGNKHIPLSKYYNRSNKDFFIDVSDDSSEAAMLPPMPEIFPQRPTDLRVGASHVNFLQVDNTTQSQKVTLFNKNPKKQMQFTIVQPFATTHFNVKPDSGVILPGDSIDLMVNTVPAKIKEARLNNGAFIIKLNNGLSAPVSVCVDTTKHPELYKQSRKDIITGSVTTLNQSEMDLVFEIKKEGDYYLFVKTNKSSSQAGIIKLDNGKEELCWVKPPYSYKSDNPWKNINKQSGVKYFYLPQGKHVFHIKGREGYKKPSYTDCCLVSDPTTLILAPEDIYP